MLRTGRHCKKRTVLPLTGKQLLQNSKTLQLSGMECGSAVGISRFSTVYGRGMNNYGMQDQFPPVAGEAQPYLKPFASSYKRSVGTGAQVNQQSRHLSAIPPPEVLQCRSRLQKEDRAPLDLADPVASVGKPHLAYLIVDLQDPAATATEQGDTVTGKI